MFVITSHFNSIKTALNAYFLQKVDCCIFEPQNRELIGNFFQIGYRSPLKCTTGPRSAIGNVSGNRCESGNRCDPGLASSIPARSHTFVEIDHEIISAVILLPSAESFKKGCCQLQAKVCAQRTG